jgi:hypothetical protein
MKVLFIGGTGIIISAAYGKAVPENAGSYALPF